MVTDGSCTGNRAPRKIGLCPARRGAGTRGARKQAADYKQPDGADRGGRPQAVQPFRRNYSLLCKLGLSRAARRGRLLRCDLPGH
jgi:hypothetical protein